MKSLVFGMIFLLCATAGNAAILIMSSEGTYTTIPNLATAAVVPNAAGKTVVVTDSQTVDNLTWPDDRELSVIKGGQITINIGKTLTVNGPFQAGLYQVFAGSGSVYFGSGSVKEVYPQWWGANGNGVDSTAKIQAAINSAVNSGVCLFFPKGRYKITANLKLPPVADGQQVIFRGEGINTKLIAYQPVTKLFEFGQTVDQTTQYAQISDMLLIGGGDGNVSTNVAYGIHAPHLTHSKFTNLWIFSFSSSGILVENGWCNYFENLQCMYSKIGFTGKTAFNQNTFNHCKFWLNEIGVFLGSGLGNLFSNCLFETNAKTGAVILSSAVTFNSCYFEGNAKISKAGIFPVGTTAGITVKNPSTTIKADLVIDGGSKGVPFIETMGTYAPSSNITITGCSTAAYADAAESFVYVIGSVGLNINNCYNTTTSIPLIKTYQDPVYSKMTKEILSNNNGFSTNILFDKATMVR